VKEEMFWLSWEVKEQVCWNWGEWIAGKGRTGWPRTVRPNACESHALILVGFEVEKRRRRRRIPPKMVAVAAVVVDTAGTSAARIRQPLDLAVG